MLNWILVSKLCRIPQGHLQQKNIVYNNLLGFAIKCELSVGQRVSLEADYFTLLATVNKKLQEANVLL